MQILKEKSGLGLINIEALLGIVMCIYIISYVLLFETEYRIFYKVSFFLLVFFGVIYILLKKRVRFTLFFNFSLIYGIILLISYIYTPSKETGIYALLYYSICLIVIFILTNYIDSNMKIDQLIKALIWGGFAVSLKTIYFYGFDLFSLASNYSGNSNSAFRVGGEIGNSNNIGMYCMFSAVFSIYLVNEKKVRSRGLYIFIGILCVSIGLLTGSKKAILVLFLGSIILFVFKSGDNSI